MGGGSWRSRMNGIALDWMVHAAVNLPDGEKSPDGNGIKIDRNLLHLTPDALGPQHDAREPGHFWGLIKWKKGLRQIDHDAVLHPTVYQRFDAAEVQHFYQMQPYRPDNLAQHDKLQRYYSDDPAPAS